MRRILVSVFAAIASFVVLANNFVPVSAPESGGEFVYSGLLPADAARLSDTRIVTPVAPITAQPIAPVAPVPDLTSVQPHAVSLADGPAQAPEQRPMNKPFSLAKTEPYIPGTIISMPRPLAIPASIAMADLLTLREHSSIIGLDAAVSARLASSPDAATIAPVEHTLLAESATPISSVAYRTFEELPLITQGFSIPAPNHIARETRTESPNTSFLKASFQEPSSVFHRARFVVEPYAPLAAGSLYNSEEAHFAASGTPAMGQSDRSMPVADIPTGTVATAPGSLTAMAVSPSAVFDRQRVVPEPAIPATGEVLVRQGNHIADLAADKTVPIMSTTIDPDTPATNVTTFQQFINAVAEVPSSLIQRMGLTAMPDSPAVGFTLPTKSDEVAAGSSWSATAERTTPSVNNAPVLITAASSMSADVLKPMSAGTLVDAPLLNENAIASSGFNPATFDRMIVSPDVPEAVLKAQPTLVSSRSSYSADLLKPMNAVSSNPFAGLDKEEIIAAAQQRDNYCDPNFVGPPIRFSQTVELKLEDLINQLHQRFGVNFILGGNVGQLPLNVKAGSIPWNVLLRSQLFVSGVRARCIDANTIELVENQQLPRLQDGAEVETRFVKLKFLQRTSSGSVDLAGRGQGGGGQNGQGGGCSAGGQGGGLSGGGGGGGGAGQQSETAAQQTSSKFDKLIIEIEKILGLRSMQESITGGGQGGQGGGQGQAQTTEPVRTNRFVTQIPGRNILVIRATEEEHELIDQIIARADRPPFQVVVKGLVYTANQDKLRDIGVSTSIFGGTADGRHTGSVVGNTLGAAGTIFDFSTIIGTFDFNVQATALEQSGVLSVKSRPFSTVIDGLCARLNVGRSIPIIIDSSLGGQGALEFIDALNKLDVTPHVIDDDNGNPVAVTLELTMFANDVDNSVIARGVPAVSERSIQTQLLLAEDKTAILGGFTVDQASRTVEKTPGIGSIPIIGELFKRRVNDKRVNRLYFAISVDVIPYPEAIRPVDVPGATTDIPSITPEQKKRSDAAEPKQVKGP